MKSLEGKPKAKLSVKSPADIKWGRVIRSGEGDYGEDKDVFKVKHVMEWDILLNPVFLDRSSTLCSLIPCINYVGVASGGLPLWQKLIIFPF